MKAMKRFLLHSERTVTCLETEKSLLVKTFEELVSCLLQTNTSGGLITNKLLNFFAPVYLAFVFTVQKESLRYYDGEVLEAIPFISKLKNNWKRRPEKVKRMVVR